MTSRKKKDMPPPSLFKRPSPKPVPGITVDEQLRIVFGSRKIDQRYFTSRNAEQIIKSNLAVMEAAAEAALNNPSILRGSEYALDIKMYKGWLLSRLEEGDALGAVVNAMALTQTWMQLRADAVFASPVHEKKNRIKQSSALTDSDIKLALEKYPTQAAAADALGISPRQLRNRIKNRKS